MHVAHPVALPSSFLNTHSTPCQPHKRVWPRMLASMPRRREGCEHFRQCVQQLQAAALNLVVLVWTSCVKRGMQTLGVLPSWSRTTCYTVLDAMLCCAAASRGGASQAITKAQHLTYALPCSRTTRYTCLPCSCSAGYTAGQHDPHGRRPAAQRCSSNGIP